MLNRGESKCKKIKLHIELKNQNLKYDCLNKSKRPEAYARPCQAYLTTRILSDTLINMNLGHSTLISLPLIIVSRKFS